MNLIAEPGQQIAYLRKLARLLGWPGALKIRAAMAGGRLGLYPAKTITLHPAALLHPVALRLGSTDADVYGQVITEGEYAPIIDDGARMIVDCGANIGLTSAYFLSRLPEARVIAIEPFAANAQLCRRNLAPYGTRAQVIEAAIWPNCTSLVLEHTQDGEWGVRVRPAGAGEAGHIRAIDIPSLGLTHIDILKIDIEGSEKELFSETEQAWLPSVSNIAIELHGPSHEERFFAALENYRYDVGRSGELTLCRNIAKVAKPR